MNQYYNIKNYIKDRSFYKLFSPLAINLFTVNSMELLDELKNEKNITADDLFQNTLFYQAILTYLKSETVQFLNNQHAFFSTPTDLNFTNTRITRCYFLLIDHPYTSYKTYKNKFFTFRIKETL